MPPGQAEEPVPVTRLAPIPGQAPEALSRSLRSQRLKWAWLLVIPFLFFSHATPKTLLAGAALSLLGLLLRGLAAGTILKDQTIIRQRRR